MRDELYNELERVINPREGEIILRTIGFPESRLPSVDATARVYWSEARRLIDAGVLVDGEAQLARAVHNEYPGNALFRASVEALEPVTEPPQPPRAEHRVPPPAGPTPTAAPQAEPEPDTYPTLVFVCSTHHASFIEEVRRLDARAELFFVSQGEEAQVGQIAMSLTRELTLGQIEDVRGELIAGGAPTDLEILQEVYDHRPYLLEALRVNGPDQQPYDLAGVPSITPVRDIAAAVLAHYEGRMGRRPRTVVDHQQPDGSFRRLDPAQSLHEAGVREGDTLNVYPEATAGHAELRMQAIIRVREEMHRYADQHEDFEIVDTDDPEFPTDYEIRFKGPGLRLPEQQSASALPRPEAQDKHNLLILLGPDFPLVAPAVFWLSPIFHPNIKGPDPQYPEAEGAVCLGVLAHSWRPALDFGQLCQMLVDMAGYRNYEISDSFNPIAALWATTEDGAAMIEAIGGKPPVPAPPPDDGALRVGALRIRRTDGAADGT
ncbi:ubiquitin-conjugating enzyme E2 [Streptomyces justiciae]|uniref:ubiquitin-conjugating enzyme E2 n=1 Tax=Streptomyces justiciae TaxID=2780140 RepID=UPI0021193669|nr:ubiquitin-conjugating enzyme E2 [Streptomyces justiciae]MCW8378494.1 effector-associated domain EAD1-containing protein [Streptomyces justiciae]